jgi:dimethylamine/trimethylamine dehydrogenase
VREFGADHVLIATGAHWRSDGRGRSCPAGIMALDAARVYTPDDLMRGRLPQGRVAVFDDDNYYMAAVLAQLLVRNGAEVVYVTGESVAASWSLYTGEQGATQAGLLASGVRIVTHCVVTRFAGQRLGLKDVFTGEVRELDAEALVLVTSREPDDGLYRELVGEDPDAGMPGVIAIGDCAQPALIAHAVYSGHKAARELGDPAPPVPARDRCVV